MNSASGHDEERDAIAAPGHSADDWLAHVAEHALDIDPEACALACGGWLFESGVTSPDEFGDRVHMTGNYSHIGHELRRWWPDAHDDTGGTGGACPACGDLETPLGEAPTYVCLGCGRWFVPIRTDRRGLERVLSTGELDGESRIARPSPLGPDLLDEIPDYVPDYLCD